MKRQISITIDDSESNSRDWNQLKIILGKLSIKVDATDQNGRYLLQWDDKEVHRKYARNAGNPYRNPDIRIEDVIQMLKDYDAQRYKPWKKTKDDFVKTRLGISFSTYGKRMRFINEKYGGLEKALAAGKRFFTDQPGIE